MRALWASPAGDSGGEVSGEPAPGASEGAALLRFKATVLEVRENGLLVEPDPDAGIAVRVEVPLDGVANLPALAVGVEICEDLWSAEPPSARLAALGATVILNLSASNEAAGKAAKSGGKAGEILSKVVTGASALLQGTAMLTLSGETREMAGGLILRDGQVEVNCAFETQLRVLREEMTAEIAAILFP